MSGEPISKRTNPNGFEIKRPINLCDNQELTKLTTLHPSFRAFGNLSLEIINSGQVSHYMGRLRTLRPLSRQQVVDLAINALPQSARSPITVDPSEANFFDTKHSHHIYLPFNDHTLEQEREALRAAFAGEGHETFNWGDRDIRVVIGSVAIENSPTLALDAINEIGITQVKAMDMTVDGLQLGGIRQFAPTQ